MNKSNLAPLTLLILAVLLSTDVFAQGGRGRRGFGNRQSNQMDNGRRDAQGQARNGNQGNRENALTANEKQALILMREEEKLARDVYSALHAKWNDNVFANIAQAESRHLNAVGGLLTRYGIADPIRNNAAGEFTASQFQQLYTSLVANGLKSPEDALKVGLQIEEMDIADLRIAIQSTNNQDITRVLENLHRGSRNHLRAFALRLNAIDGTYVATSLPQADFDLIASSQQEPGRNNRKRGGRGNLQNGRGQTGLGTGQGRHQGHGNDQGRGKWNRR